MSWQVWDDNYLNLLIDAAEKEIVNTVDCVFERASIAVQPGLSVYQLPDFIRKMVSVTWKGKLLFELSPLELQYYSQNYAYVDPLNAFEPPLSVPLYYSIGTNDLKSIKFFPTPAEQIPVHTPTDDIYGNDINKFVIISYYRTIDSSNPLTDIPNFLRRRTIKAYVLYRAFLKEGKGQNIVASDYYRKKWDFAMSLFRDINNNVFVSKSRILGDYFNIYPQPARPVLPPEFEQ
jgi:hypothetical protein